MPEKLHEHLHEVSLSLVATDLKSAALGQSLELGHTKPAQTHPFDLRIKTCRSSGLRLFGFWLGDGTWLSDDFMFWLGAWHGTRLSDDFMFWLGAWHGTRLSDGFRFRLGAWHRTRLSDGFRFRLGAWHRTRLSDGFRFWIFMFRAKGRCPAHS